jgi:hypothetical protein
MALQMPALSVATVKSKPSFEYQAAHLLVTKPSCASLDWMPMIPYKLGMALQTPALLIATIKSKPSFKYQAAHLLVTKTSCASWEWIPMTPYKSGMALQMPSPINRSLRREEDDDDGFQGRRQQAQVCS